MMWRDCSPSRFVTAPETTPTNVSASASGICAKMSLARRVMTRSRLGLLLGGDHVHVQAARLAHETQGQRAPERLPPRRLVRAPDHDVTHGVGARELEDRVHR